jgi:hypothetical protein
VPTKKWIKLFFRCEKSDKEFIGDLINGVNCFCFMDHDWGLGGY